MDKVKQNTLTVVYLLFVVMGVLTTMNASAQLEVMRLNPGESRVIKTDFDTNTIAVGNPDICDVTRVGPREVLINAIVTGKTNILIWDAKEIRQEIDVIVGHPKDAEAISKEVTEMVKNIEGVTVRVAGDRVMVEGSVFSRIDFNKINNIVNGLPDVVNTVTISSVLRKVEAEEIEKAIDRKDVQVRPTEDGFLLQGMVSSEREAALIEAIAGGFTDNLVSALGIKKTIAKKIETNELIGALIQVDLRLIEIERDALSDLSSAFTASTGANYNASSNSKNVLTGTLSLNEPNLRKLQDAGNARSLVQQSLVTQSSEHATFFVGEEFPITVSQDGGQLSTDYKKIGISFDIMPVAIKGGIVNMGIGVESSVVTGEARGGAPILSTAQLRTSTHLFSGESISLGGLIRQRVSQSFFGNAQFPGAPTNDNQAADQASDSIAYNNKPNRYLNQHNEVLVIVSTKILQSPDEAIQRLKPEIQKSFKEYEYEDLKEKRAETEDIYKETEFEFER